MNSKFKVASREEFEKLLEETGITGSEEIINDLYKITIKLVDDLNGEEMLDNSGDCSYCMPHDI